MRIKIFKNMGFFGIFVICQALPILFAELTSMDEIWNYSFARNIANGLAPYIDFNMTLTPLSSYAAAVALKLLGDQLMVMRVLELALAASMFFVFEKLLYRICKYRRLSIMVSVLLAMICSYGFSYDYNFLVQFFILVILYLEGVINDTAESKKLCLLSIVIGILGAFSFMSKQTTGAFVILAILLNCILRRRYKLLKWRVLGVAVPLLVFAGGLFFSGAIPAFWDYTVIGILHFKNARSLVDFIRSDFLKGAIVIGVLSVVPICAIKMLRRKMPVDNGNLECMLLTTAGMAVIYPIADMPHFLACFLPVVLLFFASRQGKHPKNIYIPFLIAGCALFAYTLSAFLSPSQTMVYSSLNHLEGIRIEEAHQEDILNVQKFITDEKLAGNEVYILDGHAILYLLPLEIYHKDYDLFSRGNIGGKVPTDMILQLKEEPGNVLLIPRDTSMANWQFPTEVYPVIRNQFIKTGEIAYYDIYRAYE